MQVGYSRHSDESVSSGWYEGRELEGHLLELVADPDVTAVWLRPYPDGEAFHIKLRGKTLDPDGPRFLSMPDPPGTTRIAVIRENLASLRGETDG